MYGYAAGSVTQTFPCTKVVGQFSVQQTRPYAIYIAIYIMYLWIVILQGEDMCASLNIQASLVVRSIPGIMYYNT